MAINYFKSKQVHAFPCAYRGYSGNTTIDPEARLNSEKNMSHIGLFRNGNADDCYTVGYDSINDILKVVIGGYYFEIKGEGSTKLDVILSGKYLSIKVSSIKKIGENETLILAKYSDWVVGNLDNADGKFYGLAYIDSTESDKGNFYFMPFTSAGDLDYTKFLPTALKSGSAGDDNTPKSLVLGSGTNNGQNSFIVGEQNTCNNNNNNVLIGRGLNSINNDCLVVGKFNYISNNENDIRFAVGNGTGVSEDEKEYNTAFKITDESVVCNDSTLVNNTLTVEKTSKFNDDVTIIKGKKLITPTINVDKITDKDNSGLEIYSDNVNITGGQDDSMLTIGQSIIAESGDKLEIASTGTKANSNNFSIYTNGLSTNRQLFNIKFVQTDIDTTTIELGDKAYYSSSSPASTVKIYKNLEVSDGKNATNFKVNSNGSFGTEGKYESITDGDKFTVSRNGVMTIACKSTTSDNKKIIINNGITEKFSVTSLGNVTANSYNATSDKRLKTNIEVYEPKKSILDLNVYKYDFITGPKNQIGCIAQELQSFCPEIVNEDENGFLSIQESKIVYLLLEEVKKLRKEVDELRGE